MLLSFVYRCLWVLWDFLISPKPAPNLCGRTLTVGDVSDIKLKHRELVLTFDDGPFPEHTEAVLQALDSAGIKATFFMIGAQARAYPDLARMVAERGHTVGSHTEHHLDLIKVDPQVAREDIDTGRQSVQGALEPSGLQAAPFFRFPFLHSTLLLQRELNKQKIIAVGADIDAGTSKELTPQQLHKQAIKRIRRRGSGIVLLHDIQARTATMLPSLLADLQANGFTIVHIVPRAI